MGKKGNAAFSLILTAIGAGLIYVGYNNYYYVSADDPYTKTNSSVLIGLIVAGVIVLGVGVLIAYNLLKAKKSSE